LLTRTAGHVELMVPDWPVCSLGRSGEATLELGSPEFFTDGSRLVRIPLRVTTLDLSATCAIELEVWGGGIPGFLAYLDDLDNSWRGWSGIKEWTDDQRNVTFRAAHPTTLLSTLRITIPASGWDGPGSWSAEVVGSLEPESVSRFAKRVRKELEAAPGPSVRHGPDAP
jgi:hypothetical protein